MSDAAVKIKLCGMSREQDIQAVNIAAPDYCGFIVDFPKSHRSISWERAPQLASLLDEGIVPVSVTVDADVEKLAQLVNGGVITTVQLHGSEDESYIARLRALAPQATVFQAFRVKDDQDIERACKSFADMILLDSGQGSGDTFDWSLVANVKRPFILAGGLKPGNLAQAVASVQPWGVDMSSGLETDKAKDKGKILAAVHEIRSM